MSCESCETCQMIDKFKPKEENYKTTQFHYQFELLFQKDEWYIWFKAQKEINIKCVSKKQDSNFNNGQICETFDSFTRITTGYKTFF